MGVETKIQWTDHTFNPWRGCTKVSPGCTNCYAETLSHRNPGVLGIWGDKGTRVVASEAMWREPPKWDREAREAGERRRVFCASLADVFEDRPELEEPRGRLWGLIETTSNLDWLLLTKRPENVVPLLRKIVRYNWPAMGGTYTADRWLADPLLGANVWLGTSVEDQRRADERIPELLKVPAAVRFLSVEPLLGPIDLGLYRVAIPKHRESWPPERVSDFWVIVGGESGPHARPCDLAWIRSIRDQCRAAGVPVFIKQLGSVPMGHSVHGERATAIVLRDPKGGDIREFPSDLQIREFPR